MPHLINELSELFVWPHAGCNHRCVSCDIWQDTSRRELTAPDVERWSQEWAELGISTVILTGGEALMHSDLFSLTKSIRAQGIGLILLSTGSLLTKYAAQVVRDFDAVFVSLDGPPEVHDTVRRVPRAYELLKRGVAALRAEDPDFRVLARCTVHRYNFQSLVETVDAARELELNRLSLIPADVTSEAFNRAGGWSQDRQEDLVVGADQLDALGAELDRLVATRADAFDGDGLLQESPERLRSHVLGYYQAFHRVAEQPPVTCNLPWGSAVIEIDGSVKPCFFQPAYGNIHEAGSMRELLNSPAAVKWRAELDVATDSTCQRCVCFRTLDLAPAEAGR